jgi:hypothetical protein
MSVAAIDSFEHLATKADLHLCEIRVLHSQDEMKNDLIRWMVGLVVYSSQPLLGYGSILPW